ncbi:MAG: chemotaxis protein CheW [Ignavibacteriae bacterium]|nr:chemotaxis protein CheW [Ignavibacteriota bacterium]
MQTLITFFVRGEEFAIDAARVAGIRDLSTLAGSPVRYETPLRMVEAAHPELHCLAMHQCLGSVFDKIDPSARLLVVESGGNLQGIIVDSVNELLAVNEREIRYLVYQRTPRRGLVEMRGAFVRGMYLQMIDIEQVIRDASQEHCRHVTYISETQSE